MTVPAGSAEWAAAPDHLAMTVCFVLDEVQDGFT